MLIWNLIFEFIKYTTLIFTWRDCCEILFFSIILYYFSIWLHADNKKNLLIPFYSYITLGCIAYSLNLYAITFFLSFFAPPLLMLFMLIHQELLQRNYITLQNKSSLPTVQDNWLELLMRVCLHTINKNKDIVIIIEQEDKLDELLEVPFKIDTPLNFTLLTVLIESSSYNQTDFIWLSKEGNLLGINATLKNTIHNQWFEKSIQDLEPFKQQAIALTQKTDAIIFTISSLLRTFTVIFQGKLFDQLQGTAALRLIKQYMVNNSDKKGFIYGYAQKNSRKQIQS